MINNQSNQNNKDTQHSLSLQHQRNIKLCDALIERKLVTASQIHTALKEQKISGHPLKNILMSHSAITFQQLRTVETYQKRQKLKLGEILLEESLITQEDLQLALGEQKVHGLRLGEILLKNEIVSEDDMLIVLSKIFHLTCVNLENYPVSNAPISRFDRSMIEKFRVFPIDVDTDKHTLTVAVSEPLPMEAFDYLCFSTGKKIQEVLVKASDLKKYIAFF